MHDQTLRTTNSRLPYVALLGLAGHACAVAHAQQPPPPAQRPADAGAAAAPGADASAAAPAAAADASAPSGPYTGPPPYFFLRPPRITGRGYTVDSVNTLLNRHANHTALVTCYTNLLGRNPHAHGNVTVRMNVITGGQVIIDRVRLHPESDAATERCFQDAIQGFQWHSPSGAPSVEFELEFDLAPTPPPGAHPAHH